MPLPTALIEEIRAVSAEHGADADAAIQALTVMMADDECLAYEVWGGPGYGHDILALDIYALTKNALFNYSEFSGGEGTYLVLFLDMISSLGVVNVSDPRSPHVLVIETGEERGRVYAHQGDVNRLLDFQRKITAARLGER